VQKPSKVDAAKHNIHPDVEALIKTGQLLNNAKAFIPAFEALKSTSAAGLYDLSKFPSDLLVTEDFVRTIKMPAGSKVDTFITDSYLRPIQWIISVPSHPDSNVICKLVIISPHEANKLMVFIKGYEKVTLHLFAPHTNVGYAALDGLDLYTVGRAFARDSVPRNLTVQLNLFAGSLYISSYAQYAELCDLLGLLKSNPAEGQIAEPDSFIQPPAGKWGLTTSPVHFLSALLMKIRREGDGLGKTHMGKVLNGQRLEEADFVTDTEMSGT
jgi:hypothetical protein